MTGNVKKISSMEKDKLDKKITMKEVSTCLKNTRYMKIKLYQSHSD